MSLIRTGSIVLASAATVACGATARNHGTVTSGAGVIIGGLKGAIVGTGGVIAATEGKDVTLPAGSIVRLRMNAPVRVG